MKAMRTMKAIEPRLLRLAVLVLVTGIVACRDQEPPSEPTPEEDHEHGGGAAVTLWTESVELFFEHPPLIAGELGEPWAIHLTFLEDFQPVREGKLTLRFVGPDGIEHTAVAGAPARDGIFTPAPSLPKDGVYQLSMTLESPKRTAEIPVGHISVFASSAELPHVEEAPAGSISFLKEQQWVIPFATARGVEREVADSIVANGEILPVPNAMARVSAPVEGLVGEELNLRAPVPGSWVEAGTPLAVLSPVPQEDAFAAQRARVERLERDVGRAERLWAVEAIPEKQLVEARHDLEMSRASLEAMGGSSEDGYELTLRAPISGLVTERNLTIGERVSAGDVLFTIVDPGTVWVRLQVPAREASRVSKAANASFTVEGNTRLYQSARVVSVGAVIDPERRTLPVIVEATNRDGSLKVGMLVEARLFLEETSAGTAIPSRAVRNEDGLSVAYVQLGGERFERRVLTLGPSDGEWTLVMSGVRPGERVVTEGAYQVRLASLSTSEIADHGHPH
jgi:RND family efflux transporter MFP subunit